jgi:hypothetical protein
MKTLGLVPNRLHTYSKSVFGAGSACTGNDAPNPDALVADSDHDTA